MFLAFTNRFAIDSSTDTKTLGLLFTVDPQWKRACRRRRQAAVSNGTRNWGNRGNINLDMKWHESRSRRHALRSSQQFLSSFLLNSIIIK